MPPWEIEKKEIHNAYEGSFRSETGEVKSRNAIELKFNLKKIQ